MKALLHTLLILFFSIGVYGQTTDATKHQDTVFIKYNKDWEKDKVNYAIDTVIFETGMRRNILTGTTILPGTRASMSVREYGLWFKQVKRSACQQEGTEKGGGMTGHINSIISTDTTLTIDFNIYDNCCYDFLCDISVDTSGTLNLITTGYGTYCFCDCCFGLTYHLSVDRDNNLSKVKAVMINGDRKTLKLLKE